MPSIDIQKVDAMLREVAALEIMPRFCQLKDGDIEMKSVDDPVTVADKAAESALIVRLTDAFPGSVVVGEESFAKDPAILSHFEGDNDVWVIDPIDGTRNFIAGVPQFGVMVARVRRRQTIAAWIHDPNSGDSLMAEQGGGVWLGEHKMHLAGHDSSLPTVGLAGSKLRKFLSLREIIDKVDGMPKLEAGSAAAFDYGRLFTGDAVFAKSTAPRASFIITYRRAMPWDHMAGLMMLAETGGHGANWAGAPYDANNPVQGLISACDLKIWDKVSDSLKEVLSHEAVP